MATGHIARGQTSRFGTLNPSEGLLRAYELIQGKVSPWFPEDLFDHLSIRDFVIQDKNKLRDFALEKEAALKDDQNPFKTNHYIEFKVEVPDLRNVVRDTYQISSEMTVIFDGFQFMATLSLGGTSAHYPNLRHHPQAWDDLFINLFGFEMDINWHLVHEWQERNDDSEKLWPGRIVRIQPDWNVNVINLNRPRPTTLAGWVGQESQKYVLPYLAERESMMFRTERLMLLLEETFGLHLSLQAAKDALSTKPENLSLQKGAINNLHAALTTAQERISDYETQARTIAFAKTLESALKGARTRGVSRRYNYGSQMIQGPFVGNLTMDSPGCWSLTIVEGNDDSGLRFATLETKRKRAEGEQRDFERNFSIFTDIQSVGTSMVSAFSTADSVDLAKQIGEKSVKISQWSFWASLVGSIAGLAALVVSLIQILK